ncbi:P-loop ATPase, Sll1717 family [Acinetobacter modestus]|jgi:hypothetical protein|uniref:P-loop ATPase, Sll1717 family n=1 Tax=Acinetobacter modestus TaxID=1776740 RepID=UPI003017B354
MSKNNKTETGKVRDSKIQLPKDALHRVHIGQTFAEYDIIRSDPQLFVSTPATLAATNPNKANVHFFIGRRGAGKTAITYEIERRFPRCIIINPQIFDILHLPLEYEEFVDTRQRPFKSLMHSMERALIDELLKVWADKGVINWDRVPDVIRRERGLIQDCDFDYRILNLTQEIFDAYTTKNDKLWLRQIKRSNELLNAVNEIYAVSGMNYIFLIDRLDESWDGSNSALITLMALMHAAVRLSSNTQALKTCVFIRENIYDRIRLIDNEFSRLETSVVFLEWTENKLIELIERRLVKPFNTKPALGGTAWECFFENDDEILNYRNVINLCQHRPRDVIMFVSYAIDAAIADGNSKINKDNILSASKRYSTSRLKDLGDEYAENFSNISIVLGLFFGLGNEFTIVAIEDFIKKLLLNEDIQKYCKDWFYDFTSPHRFVELLFSIGFIGVKFGISKAVEYKESGKDSNAKIAFDQSSIFIIHPTYREALNLRPILLADLKEETILKYEGILEDIPESFNLNNYKNALEDALRKLKSLPIGTSGASEFEDLVGDIIKLCFFRSLTNVQPRVRTSDGCTIKDWIVSNRANDGFWETIRNKYGSTQVIWECKNYLSLKADDFHQMSYYLNNTIGMFAVVVFRGEVKESDYNHLNRLVRDGKMVLLLGQKDLEVFLRQAIKGIYKESHIQERFDSTIRRLC